MTEVDVYRGEGFSDVALERLRTWAESATAAYKVAEQLVRTSFVPEGFRGKPYEATAAILAGLECGLSPMASLRSFDVIGGQAAPRAITLRAIVQSHGHEIVLVESTATRCKMRGRRRGTNAWTDVTWTSDRAQSLGLLNKSNWKSQPQAMLIARATSELARLIAADAILGIGYSAEEIADGAGPGVDLPPTPTPQQLEVVADNEPASGGRRMSRKKPTPPPADTPDDRTSEAQRRKIMASFADLGLAGPENRDDRIALTGALIGRTIDSTNDLTPDEISTLIDQLVRLNDGELSATLNDDGTWTVTAIDTTTGEILDKPPTLDAS